MSGNGIRPTLTKGVARVPVIIQLEALECGAACLAMILAYYGKWVPLEKVRIDCGVSRDGSKAKNIFLAAENYGLKTEAFRMSPDVLRDNGTFPCIVHWDMNHFVVVKGFRGGHVYINDPARGEVRLTMEEFDESFTGIALLFSPTDKFVPGGKRRSTLEFARKRLTGARSAVIFVMLTTAISYLFGIANSVTSRIFMDRLLTGRNPDWLYPFISVMILLAVIQITVAWVQSVYSLKLDGKMAIVGVTSYMWKVLHMPMEFFSQRLSGDIQARASLNAQISSTIINTTAPLALNTVMMVFYLVVMLRQSLLLTAVGISTIVINALMSRLISEKRINISRVMVRDLAMKEANTVAGIEMIETIKASGAENGFFGKWAGYQASANAQEVSAGRMNSFLGVIPGFLATTANYGVLLLGILLTMHGRFSLGAVMMFQGFLGSFMSPAMTIISAGQTVQEMRTQMERIDDVMEYEEDENTREREDPEGAELTKLRGDIELKNVTFGYSRLEEPLIRDFSMSVRPGDKIALVGESGCGKSTIAKLISGLYIPWSGEILFDGRPRSAYPRDVMTGSIAVVDQDITLFEDTIANNIKMWDSSILDFEMIMAARDAQIHEDIMELQGGYQHRISSEGRGLSGGQRQRMEIARVLAQDPTIVILDEATSALDARTEHDVVTAISERGVTCIVIAHRLSTIRDCDNIIVFDHGKVVEQGTHDELMKLGGAYAELVASE